VNDSDTPLWFILLAAAAFLVIGYIGYRIRQKRIAAYRAWAAQHGFHYAPHDYSVSALSSTEPFGTGRNRRGVDVFRGVYRGKHIVFFEYQYMTGSGKNSTQHRYQVIAIDLPAPRPMLDIGHENFFSRRFGNDIDFENQAFNDVFKVNAENRRFAFDVIHPRTMEWMLADQRARTYRWRFDGQWPMTFREGALNLGEVFFYADFLIDVYAQVPRHVWAAH
jgi:hypothetical protein